MDSQKPGDDGQKPESRILNLKPAPHGHKPIEMVASTEDDKRPNSEGEWDGLLRWENEGGQQEVPLAEINCETF
jgi:hypothetical protein